MPSKELWPLIQSSMQAFNPHYRESIQQIFADFELEGTDWFYSYLAYGLDLEPLSANVLHQMTPYGNIKTQAERLAQTAERGYLERIEKDVYRQTDAGRKVVKAFFASAGKAIAPLEPLSPDMLLHLADLLARIIKATEKADTPAIKTHFHICRRTDPGPDAAAASRIDQYLTDLLRYRDDAHLAAWADLDVDGRTWDAFTNIWQERAATAPALAEALANRNYTEADYTDSLAKLVKRGWIEETDGVYHLTDNGRAVREEAEATTDRYFFTGWSALTEAEAAKLDELLIQMRDNLRDLAGDQATAARADLWPTVNNISGSLFQLTRDAVDPAIEKANLAERGLAFTLIQAASFDPEPISSLQIIKRFPYANPASWDKRLAKLAALGYVTLLRDGSYELTDDGRLAFNTFLGAFRGKLEVLAESTDVDLNRLAELLGQVVNSCLNAPTPPGTWGLAQSHRLFPNGDAAPLAQIDQYLDDLNAFRDDAHIASWSHLDISGAAWEFFSLLWQEKVQNVAEMAERAVFRGHDETVYTQALSDLVAKGWVTGAGDSFALTTEGTAVREDAETQTNRYFYLPWMAVNSADTQELRELLTELDTQLKTQVEAIPA